MTLVLTPPAITDKPAVATTPPSPCDRSRITGLPVCTVGCPLTNGGECPDDQATIDKCPEC